MKKGYNESGGVGSIAWLDEIRDRQNNYANLMGIFQWEPDMLSDLGHLALVDVPRLLAYVEEKRNRERDNGDANSDPRSDGIGSPEPALELMQPQQPVALTPLLIETRNRFADFFIRHSAVFLGCRVTLHTSNENEVSCRHRGRARPEVKRF